MQNVNSDNGVTCGLVGSSGAGKSTVLRKVFMDDVFGLRKDKDYIITVFTESPNSDAFIGLSKDIKVDGHGLDEDQINWAYRMNSIHGKRYNFMFILDDVLQLRYQKQLERMFLIMRNTNITSVVSIQYPNLIPRPIRTSVYYIFCMRFNTREGVEMAVDYFLSSYIPGNRDEKIEIYTRWAENHRFYVIDNLNYKVYAVDNNFMCKELPRIIGDYQMYTPAAEWESNINNNEINYKPKQEEEQSDYYTSSSESESDLEQEVKEKLPQRKKRKLNVQPFIQNKRKDTPRPKRAQKKTTVKQSHQKNQSHKKKSKQANKYQ